MISNPTVLDHILDNDGRLWRLKTIEIGPWDMDTVIAKAVNHGITTFTRITATAYILVDGNSFVTPFTGRQSNGVGVGVDSGCITQIGPLQVVLERMTGGFFDTTNYNDPVQNRGYVYLWYTESP